MKVVILCILQSLFLTSIGFGSEMYIELRNFEERDLPDFYEWASDPDVTQFLMWDNYKNKESAREFLVRVAIPHPWLKAIVCDGKVVGSISLEPGKGSKQKVAEVGYVIAKKYWSRGIGTAALKAALKTGFDDLDLVRIEAYVDPCNLASIKVIEKSGMTREGYLRKCILQKGVIKDRLLYALTR
ncbi:MAG: GNAT family N-acetyltransferase [Deltaproteobacteria bacterium]|nr:GNAT family N-acetyltransferase [Deltaproteobacteria bacterium]